VADEPNLFGIKPKEKRKKADPLPSGTMTRLIGAWSRLFEGKYREKPLIRPRDAAALKRMVLKVGEVVVSERLKLYIELDDPFVRDEGFPLALMEDRWNKLIAAASKAQGRVPDADSTDRYLRTLRRR
jgi:hypothetical protein